MKQKELLDRVESFGKSRDEYLEAVYNRWEQLLGQEWISDEQRSQLLDRLMVQLETDVSGTRKGRAGAWIALLVVGGVILLSSVGAVTWITTDDGDAEAVVEVLTASLNGTTRVVLDEDEHGVQRAYLSGISQGLLDSTFQSDEMGGLRTVLTGEAPIGILSAAGPGTRPAPAADDEFKWKSLPATGGAPVGLGPKLEMRTGRKFVVYEKCGTCREPLKDERNDEVYGDLWCGGSPWYSTRGSLAFRFVRGESADGGLQWDVQFAELGAEVNAGKIDRLDNYRRPGSELVTVENFVIQSGGGDITQEPQWITHHSWAESYVVAMGVGGFGYAYGDCGAEEGDRDEWDCMIDGVCVERDEACRDQHIWNVHVALANMDIDPS